MLARQDSQARVFRHPRIGRARLPFEQGHFTKEVAAVLFGERDLVSVLRSHADTDLPLFDDIHCVAFIPGAEQERARFAIEALEEFTQFERRLVVERFKQWHMAQRLNIHFQESDGTAVTITAMRATEKRQLSQFRNDPKGKNKFELVFSHVLCYSSVLR
jgi:hypothetical protein